MELSLVNNNRKIATAVVLEFHELAERGMIAATFNTSPRMNALYVNRQQRVNVDALRAVIVNEHKQVLDFTPLWVEYSQSRSHTTAYVHLSKSDFLRIQQAHQTGHYIQPYHVTDPTYLRIKDIATTLNWHCIKSWCKNEHVRIYHHTCEESIGAALYSNLYAVTRNKHTEDFEKVLMPGQAALMFWHIMQASDVHVELIPDPEVNKREFFRIDVARPNYREFAIHKL